MLSEEDDRLALLPPAFPRTFQNYFLKNGLKKKKEVRGGSMKQWWEFLVLLAGLEQKLSVCQRRKSLFICYSSTQCRPDLYLVGISAAELDLTFIGLLLQAFLLPQESFFSYELSPRNKCWWLCWCKLLQLVQMTVESPGSKVGRSWPRGFILHWFERGQTCYQGWVVKLHVAFCCRWTLNISKPWWAEFTSITLTPAMLNPYLG